jgi:hypothetical protein
MAHARHLSQLETISHELQLQVARVFLLLKRHLPLGYSDQNAHF